MLAEHLLQENSIRFAWATIGKGAFFSVHDYHSYEKSVHSTQCLRWTH